MRKSDVITYFGNKVKIASALGITPAAISSWGEIIPESRAYQIEYITNGKLNADYYRERIEEVSQNGSQASVA